MDEKCWPDDDNSRMTRALAELSERCEELERRVSVLEDVQEFEDWDGCDDDEDEYLEDDEPRDDDEDEVDFLGDIEDDEEDIAPQAMANALRKLGGGK